MQKEKHWMKIKTKTYIKNTCTQSQKNNIKTEKNKSDTDIFVCLRVFMYCWAFALFVLFFAMQPKQ